MLKICLLTYFNQYESKRYFTARLSEALRRQGVETLILDPKKGIISKEMKQAIQSFSPDLLFSFNSTVSDGKGKFLWDYLELPALTALVDPAFYAMEMARSPFARFSSVDLADCKWLIDNGLKNTFFWPHAVENTSISLSEPRIYDVVFLGTCTDFEGLKMQWNKTLDESEILILKRAIEKKFSDSQLSLLESLSASVAEHPSLDPRKLDFKSIFHFLDNYVRGKDRFELIRSIRSAKVHVFGEASWNNQNAQVGWKQYLGDLPNVILHPAVSYAEGFKITSQSKICLNSMPFFKHGSHERILNALITGAVPLTTYNGFIEQSFTPDEDLLCYTSGKWEHINEKVKALLSNETKRKEMAEAGAKKVRANHTWDQRATALIKHLQ